MPKGEHLKRSGDYSRVRNIGQRRRGSLVRIMTAANGTTRTRYGLVASRRVGNAVTRNRVRRRLREIMRNLDLNPGWDIVVVATKDAGQASFDQLKEDMVRLLGESFIRQEQS